MCERNVMLYSGVETVYLVIVVSEYGITSVHSGANGRPNFNNHALKLKLQLTNMHET